MLGSGGYTPVFYHIANGVKADQVDCNWLSPFIQPGFLMFNSTEITGYHTFSTLSWIIKLHQSSLIQGTCVLYITEGLSSLVSEVRVNIL